MTSRVCFNQSLSEAKARLTAGKASLAPGQGIRVASVDDPSLVVRVSVDFASAPLALLAVDEDVTFRSSSKETTKASSKDQVITGCHSNSSSWNRTTF